MRNTKQPLFQHRHYVAIAKALARLNPADALPARTALSVLFKEDNYAFSIGRFHAACEGEPENGRDR